MDVWLIADLEDSPSHNIFQSSSVFKSYTNVQVAPRSPRHLTKAQLDVRWGPPNVRSLLPPTAFVLRVPGPAVVVGGAAGVAVVVAAYMFGMVSVITAGSSPAQWFKLTICVGVMIAAPSRGRGVVARAVMIPLGASVSPGSVR